MTVLGVCVCVCVCVCILKIVLKTPEAFTYALSPAHSVLSVLTSVCKLVDIDSSFVSFFSGKLSLI